MTKWLDRGIIHSKIHYCFCSSQKEYGKILKSLNIEDFVVGHWLKEGKPATTHFWIAPESRVAIVCVDLTKESFARDPITLAGILVHEAVHIWQEICDDMGEDRPPAEFEAYSVQWISQELMWEYARRIKNA